MEKITTDISTFENLRKDGYVYVDKTDLLWRLAASKEGRQFFISRPRRFGKSLLLSTLQCIFEGKRQLFKGLKIDKLGYDWKKYPVVMLNMADVVAPTVDKLRENLSSLVKGLVKSFELEDVDIVSEPGMSLGNFFKALAAKAEKDRAENERKRERRGGDHALGQGLVVLVDEYDVPLQGFLGDRKALLAVREMMHDFYIQLKNNEKNIRFLMLTGVTKNELILPIHLTDLDWSKRYKNLLSDFLSQKERQLFEDRMNVAMRRALGVGDTESFVRLSARLKDSSKQTDVRLVIAELFQYFNKLPFGISLATEDSSRRQFQFFMEMLGARVLAEEGSAFGYADAILETKKFVWVFEFKFNKSAKAALAQIREKGYADAYKGDKRPVTLVGINFRTTKRNIDEPLFAAL